MPVRLLTGPAGSGKTAFVVERLIEALRSNRYGVQLLVPTATLAEHLQNRVAREGLVFRRNLIQTLSGFIDRWAGDPPQVADAVLYLIVEEAVARANRPEFRRVAGLPGFSAAVARTIGEFSAAGCDSRRLGEHLPDSPLGAAFLSVYRETDRILKRQGWALRAERLERAAVRIRNEGTGGIETVWLDGFHALPDPELAVVEALGDQADVTLTLGDTDAGAALRGRLWAMGFEEERAAGHREAPELTLVRASGIEREAEEIARRIVDEAAAGRPFREIGIIIRAAETYVPVLRATLERFAIPARFYFDSELARHAAVRFLTSTVDAMLSGWDHATTLAALRLAPRFADSPAMDRFDFRVGELAPDSGLGGLKALLEDAEGPLAHLIDSVATIEEWRSFEMQPADWALRFRSLRNLFRAARPPEGADHELALLWRGQSTALDLFDEAASEAAQALDPEGPLGIGEFWRALKSVVRLKPLRLEDGRRNVVHILSAPEARQWVLPVVFVCGMVERQFPQFHLEDPFFPDAARTSLQAAGIRVRTAREFESEERALFDSAITRATEQATLSYPEFDAGGEGNLPSLFLEGLALEAEETCPIRPQPRCVLTAPPPPVIHAPQLLATLRQKTTRLAPTALESYQQCPFQYFGSHLLRLQPRPARPEERLDFRAQGKIVHAVLAAWYRSPEEIGALFDRIFEESREQNRIPAGYHTERLRQAMRDDLERFAADATWPRLNFRSRMEEKFEFPLDESLRIAGRIDRVDTAADGRTYILDYKYSAAQRLQQMLKNGDQFQAPLYLMAAEKVLGAKPAGVFYVGLKGAVAYAGWSEAPFLEADPMPEEWLAGAARRALHLVEEIRQGRIAAAPLNTHQCRLCDSRDVCRIEVIRPAAAGGIP